MDNIKPVSFSDKTINEKDFVENRIISKAPIGPEPDPDSGSGSGSGSVSGVNGSGHGTVFSSIGGHWNVNCGFTWTANYIYQKVTDILGIETFALTGVQISLSLVTLSCTGVDAGDTYVSYQPWTYITSNLEISNNNVEVDVDSGNSQFDATFHSKPIVLKVSEIRKSTNSEGKETESTQILTESKVINLDITFYISPYFVSGGAPKITFRSCVIS